MKLCNHCKTNPAKRGRQYCSLDCSRIARAAIWDEKTCLHCGDRYKIRASLGRKQIYCGVTCYHAAKAAGTVGQEREPESSLALLLRVPFTSFAIREQRTVDTGRDTG